MIRKTAQAIAWSLLAVALFALPVGATGRTPSPTGTLTCGTSGAASFASHGVPDSAQQPASAHLTLRGSGVVQSCDASHVMGGSDPILSGALAFTATVPSGANCKSLSSTLAGFDKSRVSITLKHDKSTVARVRTTIGSASFTSNGNAMNLSLTSAVLDSPAFFGETVKLSLHLSNQADVNNCTSGLAPLKKLAWSSSTLAIVALTPPPLPPPPPTNLLGLRLMNYYPSANAWTNMWTNFDPNAINRDFAAQHNLGVNAVRVILQAWTIGYPNPTATMKDEIARTVQLAAQNGLLVQLTLFDWWSSWTDIAGSKTWASAVLAPYKNDARIANVEIKNEIDWTDPSALAWARAMLPFVKTASGSIPVTISLSGQAHPDGLQALKNGLGSSQPDFYSYHFYGNPSDALGQLTQAKAIAAPLPLFVGETGMSTGPGNAPVSASLEGQQSSFYSTLFADTRSLGLADPAPWIWQDFTPSAIPHNPAPSSTEFRYGLFRVDGTPKPAAATLRSLYQQG